MRWRFERSEFEFHPFEQLSSWICAITPFSFHSKTHNVAQSLYRAHLVHFSSSFFSSSPMHFSIFQWIQFFFFRMQESLITWWAYFRCILLAVLSCAQCLSVYNFVLVQCRSETWEKKVVHRRSLFFARCLLTLWNRAHTLLMEIAHKTTLSTCTHTQWTMRMKNHKVRKLINVPPYEFYLTENYFLHFYSSPFHSQACQRNIRYISSK